MAAHAANGIRPVVSSFTLRKRMKNGWSFLKATTTPGRPDRIALRLAEFGITPVVSNSVIRQRIAKGWSLADAASTPLIKKRGQRANALCQKNGIVPIVSYTTVQRRLDNGWFLLDAAFTPAEAKEPASSDRQEKRRNSKLFRLAVRRMLADMGLQNVTDKQLMTAIRLMLPRDARRHLKLRIKYTALQNDEIKRAEREYGLSRKIITNRLRLGWSFEEAVSVPPLPREIRRYPDGISAICAKYGLLPEVPIDIVRRRIKKGHSFYEAMTAPKKHTNHRRWAKEWNLFKTLGIHPVVGVHTTLSRAARGMPFFLAAMLLPNSNTVSLSHWGLFDVSECLGPGRKGFILNKPRCISCGHEPLHWKIEHGLRRGLCNKCWQRSRKNEKTN